MERALLKKLEENFSSYHDKLLEVMKEYSYRFKRYDVDYTVALYATTAPVEIENIKSMVRYSDTVVVLEENLFAVFFDFVEPEAGLKASENLLSKIEPQMFGKKIFVSIVNSKDASTKEEHIRKLLDLLRYEIKNNIDDVPLTI